MRWKVALAVLAAALVVVLVGVLLWCGRNEAPGDDHDGSPSRRRRRRVLRDGVELLYRIDHAEAPKGSALAEHTERIIRRRLDAYGLEEALVKAEGGDTIRVRVPDVGQEELERIKGVIENIGHLEFRLVADPGSTPDDEWKESGEAPEGYTAYNIRSLKKAKGEETTDRILISDRAEMTGEYITKTYVKRAGTGESLRPAVILGFTPVGEQKFGTLTGDNVHKRLAIVLNTRRVEGQILPKDKKDDGEKSGKGICYSAPAIRSAIFGDASIEADFDDLEASKLRTVLEGGSLPAPLVLVREARVAGRNAVRGRPGDDD